MGGRGVAPGIQKSLLAKASGRQNRHQQKGASGRQNRHQQNGAEDGPGTGKDYKYFLIFGTG